MDSVKTGELIKKLRQEKKLTQKQLAERLCVSDKAVSKWECGNGCPDISLLLALSDILGADLNTFLSGKSDTNEKSAGDMKKIRFYVCKKCGNIITAQNGASVSCCGEKLTPQTAEKAPESEKLDICDAGGELFVSSNHEMTKEHYISFAAYVNDSTVMIFKQYPEWNMQFSLPLCRKGKIYFYCTKHGLFYQDFMIERKKPAVKIDLF